MKGSGAFAMVLLIIGMVVIIPIFTIMSMNHLFGMGWVVDIETWLSVFWLSAILSGSLTAASKKK